ncbi:DNA polymerase-3 subunit alpha (Gram-positive type) [Metamycoplasma subdolum]|uniref:DNA polymerase III PolC-type n=1 Tax=Metamycoplasma subdolum TaxID=92407 RepID=A0A3M0A1M4_9BACT|nr:PolC-type DNA polymerase III [Metamycoplasma subdolum]RMA78547.1 DNA polymerase-3 subunit alpha (Gram-positive type) [Metamycoplasma subdolum]WPB50479.1 PolC-type DNA polymerase III [Metamycoplasma subdolum]
MKKLDERIRKICEHIKLEPSEFLYDAEVLEFGIQKSNDRLLISLRFEKHPPINDFKKFYLTCVNILKKVDLKFQINYVINDIKVISDYLSFIIAHKYANLSALLPFISPQTIKIDEEQITIYVSSEEIYRQFSEKTRQIKTALKEAGFSFPNVLIAGSNLGIDIIKREKQQKIQEKMKQFDSLAKQYEEERKIIEEEQQNFSKYKRKTSSVRLTISEAVNYQTSADGERVQVTGEVYKIESRRINGNRSIFFISISDYQEAIQCKLFLDSNGEDFKMVEVGKTYTFQGKLTHDNFYNANSISLYKTGISKAESISKLSSDKASRKRVELAARTNMSAQDGISSVTDYLNVVKQYGHEAIAICDRDSVQSFPTFYNTVKQMKGIKPIYGATFSSVDSRPNFFYNFKEFDIKSTEYVVFDLEATGLSARFSEIIEFGAKVLKDGVEVEEIQFFIKPTKLLPSHVVKQSNIKDEMLKDAISQEEGIKKIYEILKDRIAVAHNANYDINVVKQKCVQYGLDESRIYGVDTLAMANFLFPEKGRINLGAVAKKVGVEYDVTSAHRADYDARVLTNIWKKMIVKLDKEHGIKKASDLFNVNTKHMQAKKIPSEVRILAKNQAGLKKLFQLISTSLTTQYKRNPQLYRDKWEKDPDLFFASAAHKSYLWEEVINGSDENIEKAIQLFDYIELPPISSFNYLVKGEFLDQEQLEFAYKDLIKKAKKFKIPCVAVSDCRYIHEFQQLIYDIYIEMPGLAGERHWANEYHKHAKINLKFLTTEEMIQEFAFLKNDKLIQEIVIDNSINIAQQIDNNIKVLKQGLHCPIFDNSDENLRKLVYEKASERYGENIDQRIKERIDRELEPIIKYGYSVTYWISHKLVKKSNEDGYVVGSRGSVGSSIVANLAGITEVNPLEPHYLCKKCKYFEWASKEYFDGWDLPDKKCPKCNEKMSNDGHNIPFETFLGFNADKFPDIDLNFSGEYQPVIHNHVKKLFGDTHTLRAGTISTVANKTAYGFCRKYAELNNIVWSSQFLDFLASKTEGVKRTTGQHPGGIIIIPKEFDVEDFTPVNYPANDVGSSWKTTHFDFNAIHDNVLKLDLLGHDDPTVLRMLEDLTNIRIKDIPKFDSKLMSLFTSVSALGIKPDDINGEITGAYGIPEFGTRFVRGMLKTAKPKTFNDLILLSGLSHGTDVWAGNAEELIKKGKKLNDCVCCRDDIMRELINYKVDKLEAFNIMEKVRKGKGLTSEWEIMLKNKKVPQWYIDSLKKIKYMFPKAHATAYVISAWRIAWFKLYYPLEFYSAFYSSTKSDSINIKIMSSGRKIVGEELRALKKIYSSNNGSQLTTKQENLIPILEITEELYARGFSIQNVNLKKSDAKKWLIDYENKSLIPPFVAVEGLGETVAQTIVKAREEHEILSIEDLIDRTKLNKGIIAELQKLEILEDLDETNQIPLF